MESKHQDIKIEFVNYHDPEDGTTSMSAKVIDDYTKKVLLELAWYYDFGQLITELNKRMAAL